MSRFRFFLLVSALETQLSIGLAVLDPEIALKNYTLKCEEIVNVSDPFDRLDLLRGKFAEGFFNSTEQIAKMLMNGPLGELVNASVTPYFPNGGTEIRLLSIGLPYLKELARTFKFISTDIRLFRQFDGIDAFWNEDLCTDAMIVDINALVYNVSRTTRKMGDERETFEVPQVVSMFESNKNRTSWPWWRTNSFLYNVEIVDQMLERMNALFCTNCSDTTARDFSLYYLKSNKSGLICEKPEPCLHKFLLRYSNYSERVYSKLVDVAGKTLFFALNLYGISQPIADGVASAEKKAKFTESVRAISDQLKLAFWDDARGEKNPISSSTVTSEYWPHTAVMTAKGAFGNETATWPSLEAPTEFYKEVGERIQKNLSAKFAFRKWFSYFGAVYWPAEESSEHCIQNLTTDVFYELRYKNANYFVSRRGRDRNDTDLEKFWQRINDSGTQARLM